MENETKRKLATIEKIDSLKPIENADFIEIAKIRGWNVVVKKGEFSENDLCVFFEIDSFLPIQDRYEFLRKSSYKKMDNEDGFRIKTQKLRGIISQGLVLPLNIKNFPELFGDKAFNKDDDVTDFLCVKKYESLAKSGHDSNILQRDFPHFIKKTNQERIQNVLEYFEIYKNVEFEETTKIDGSSMTVYYNNKKYGVCSRNVDLGEISETIQNPFINAAEKYNLKKRLELYDKNIALQGELCGSGIQGNNEKLKELVYCIFNIYDIDNQRHFKASERIEIINHLNSFYSNNPIIHIELKENIKPGDFNLEKILKHVEGKSMFEGKMREGSVFKSTEYINGDIVSFKVINNNYLLKKEK